MAIVAIVATFVVPAAFTILNGSNLTQASQMIEDRIGLARQTALAHNDLVEVRFYQYADPAVAGEIVGQPATGRYRAMQSFEQLSSGAFSPLGSVQQLPNAVILDAGPTLSTLLGSAQAKTWSTASPQPRIPRAGLNYNCCYFQFRSDGSTNLSTSGTWFLTLHSLQAGDSMTSPPPNFFTVQIDPSNGHTRFFRP